MTLSDEDARKIADALADRQREDADDARLRGSARIAEHYAGSDPVKVREQRRAKRDSSHPEPTSRDVKRDRS
jgi:hypothetical protein